jgi:type IV pilus assembly protein PilN
MIRINLLPHREEKRKARRIQFFALAGMVSVLGGLIVFLGFSIIGGYISAQQDKNSFLTKEIEVLDKQISQIKGLQEQIRLLLSRKQVIENLQRDRAESVNLLNDIAKQMPEGVFLKTLRQTGTKIDLAGSAQSNARVSTLMRNMAASPFLEQPVLIETRAGGAGPRKLNDFTMTVLMKRPKVDDGKADAAKPAAGAKP